MSSSDSSTKCFRRAKSMAWYLHHVRHYSPCNDCHMTFAIFVPENTLKTSSKKMLVITYLSGLTCDDTNVSQKGNAFQSCAESNVCFLMPDTSPRGHEKIEGEVPLLDLRIGCWFLPRRDDGRVCEALQHVHVRDERVGIGV